MPTVIFAREGPHAEIQQVVDACGLPDCRLLIVPDEPMLDGVALGEATLRSLAHHRHSGAFTGRRDDAWDVGIALSTLATSLAPKYPAYFAAIVSHELGHLWIALSDQEAHIYSLFLWNHRAELGPCGPSEYHAQPLERAADAYAVDVVSRVFGRQQLRNECAEAAALDPVRLAPHARALRQVDGADTIARYRDDLAAVYGPCAQAALTAWKRAHESATERGTRSITNDAPPIAGLFAPRRGAT